MNLPIGVAANGDIIFADKTVKVVVVEGLNGTPAAELAVRGWCETVERGFGDGNLNMNAGLNAMIGYAANGRDMLPVGVITWDATDSARAWVYQSYVLPEFRGRGVYSAMWAALVDHAMRKLPKVRSIESATHIRNIAMREIAKKLGRREEAVILRFDITR